MKKGILITSGVFPPDIGGPASYAPLIAERLSKGRNVSVVTYSSVRKLDSDNKQPYRIIRVWSKLPKGLKHIFFLINVVNQAKESEVIFSLNAVSSGLPSLIAAKIFKKKFVVKIVGDAAWERAVNSGRTSLLLNDFQLIPKRGLIKVLDSVQKYVCKKADVIIVPSKYLAQMVADWGVNGGKVRVIYNAVDFTPSDMTQQEARVKIGIAGNIILSAGRLVPWKGFRMLIKIMPKLLEINQFFRLVIVGDGPDKSNLEMMVKNMGMDRKIYLVGRKSKEEMAIHLTAASMFVLDTGYEGFSHQILEAMAAGVPVVTTSVGGNPEIIEQGKNGFMVRYNDEFNLIESIRSLWNLPELREQFIEEGKITAAKFNSDLMIRSVIETLQN